MKTIPSLFATSILFQVIFLHAQTTVTDYEGHVYNTVTIGEQVWLKENLKSRYYADGVPIDGAEAYNNSDSLNNLYGLLYTWNAAMRNNVNPSVQGACPSGWHIPAESEWSDLDVALGGPQKAGGKMKSTAANHWNDPNTGATNSSGFSALPAGEFDAIFTNQFQFLHEYAFFWTSTQSTSVDAVERWLSYDNEYSSSGPISKLMKNSVRCVRDASAGIDPRVKEFGIRVNNPVRDKITVYGDIKAEIHKIEIVDMTGQVVHSIGAVQLPFTIPASELNNGLYFLRIQVDDQVMVRKISKTN